MVARTETGTARVLERERVCVGYVQEKSEFLYLRLVYHPFIWEDSYDVVVLSCMTLLTCMCEPSALQLLRIEATTDRFITRDIGYTT